MGINDESILMTTDTTNQLSLISEDDIKAIIRPEENLQRHAYFIFPQPKTKGLAEPRGKEWAVTLPGGEEGTASIRIEPSTAHLALTCKSLDVYLALVEIWNKRGKPTEPFHTSLSEICKELGLKKGSRALREIEEELNKLLKTNISWTLSYRMDKEHKSVKNQTVLSIFNYSNMAGRSDKSDKFEKVCEIGFHPSILQNLSSKNIIPVNFAARKLITSPTGKVLYNQVDIILSSTNKPYSRTALNLVDDLELTKGRYKYKSQRKILLEGLMKSLNGRRLGNFKILNVSMEETADKSDFKLTFTSSKNAKVESKIPKKKYKKLKVMNNNPGIVEYLSNSIASVVGHEKENIRLYKKFATHYSENAIFRALSEFKEQSKGLKNDPRMFTAILHRIIHEMNYESWITACTPDEKNCKYKRDLFNNNDQ